MKIKRFITTGGWSSSSEGYIFKTSKEEYVAFNSIKNCKPRNMFEFLANNLRVFTPITINIIDSKALITFDLEEVYFEAQLIDLPAWFTKGEELKTLFKDKTA